MGKSPRPGAGVVRALKSEHVVRSRGMSVRRNDAPATMRPTHHFLHIVEEVHDAWRTNRPIVPIVGAGLSADAGIPIIRSVERYFGKFQRFLADGVYLPKGPNLPKALSAWRDRYAREPWKYVEHFGWPDRFQLNQDLLDCDSQAMTSQVSMGWNDVLKRIYPWEFEEIHKKIREARTEEPGLTYALIGDWKRMTQHFTRYQGHQADALFSKLSTGRGPSLGHLYMAFLAKLLGIRTILTFNFDDLLERSLEREGLYPKIFAMEQGYGLPDESLTRDSVSIVKLHGSNHSILVNERVDHPLTEEYKARFSRLIGDDPLLLVVGCSGDDYRLRDLIQHSLLERKSNSSQSTRVAWLHFEEETPAFLRAFDTETLKRVRTIGTNNPGATEQQYHN